MFPHLRSREWTLINVFIHYEKTNYPNYSDSLITTGLNTNNLFCFDYKDIESYNKPLNLKIKGFEIKVTLMA